ncbi:ubiquitin carboxyl-terminal hydrolase 20-like isoform X2 [Xenia sp. Carnegie-2017]|uniref:ubiquitin carboxyl-terminal hydrolase 20-like isoform X2 n=1 Tax=Xenia sp. Carnegie-2017 TaxID=2897299 RepID=UPI001F03301E|nr:ubiquitin carboxyl-terminal hydrolase 20-like isoform X2 [Xenia sp. Carnegie-2017]
MLRQPSLVSETRLKTMICPHIALIRKIYLIEMDDKKQCDECNQKASDLWLCMQCCSFVGCGEKVGNHVKSHHEKTNHAVYLSKENKGIWCFGCGVSLDEVQLDVSEDAVQYKSMEEELDNDDNVSEEMEEEAAMIDKDYFDGFEKGMKPRGLTGLKNIGNTCYMNSALQALSNSPSLMQFFLDCSSYVKSNRQANLSEVYAALVSDMWSKKRPTCVTPSDFMGCFQRLNPQFRGYRQQDTQEFLRVLMDLLHEEMKEPMPPEDIKPEIPLRKLTKRMSSRSKRLLGGQTIVEKHNTGRVQNGGRKTRGFPYLRNRRKEASKSISTTTTTNQNVEKTRPLSPERFLRNTNSCPELRKAMSRDDINSASFEPRISLGVVNMASDDFSISGNRKGAGLSLERSISDSEIYCHRTAGFRGESKDTSDQKRPPPVEYASVISDLFNGKIRSSVQCLTCKKISSTMETFQDLSLSIPGKEEISVIHSSAQCNPISRDSPTVSGEKGFFRSLFDWFASWIYGPRVSFEDCLAAFFSADELKGDNMYRCEHCSMLRNGMKQCRVYKLPEMLCIHLKRFRHEYFSSSKISSFISFPLEALDVKKYLTSDFAGECSKYDLVAVISHYGSVGGGHYVACCKNFITGKWYEFNDSKVSEVSESYVQSCEAYVLFYRKRGENIIKYRQKFFRLTKSNEGKPTTHYVSKKWLTMFYTCAEPGPIANGSFLCKHGKIEPNKLHLKDLLKPLQSACWLYLLKKFGGGPEITNLDVCAVCENELKELEQRRRYELKTWKEKLDDSKSSSPQCYISMKWFKEWKSFVDGNCKDPPGPIYNHKTGQQRKQVPKSVWNFLFSIYGGSHVLPFQEN